MALKDLSILVVEDEPSLELENLLQDIGYQSVISVDNSAEAFEYIYTDQPDLILMANEIKGRYSGLQVAEKIKHLKIPILFITSLWQQAIYDKALQTNFIGFMVKPLEPFSIRSSIELAIQERYINNN